MIQGASGPFFLGRFFYCVLPLIFLEKTGISVRMKGVARSLMKNPCETILGNIIFFLACAAIVQLAPIFYNH